EASTSWLKTPLRKSDGQKRFAGCAKGALTAAVQGLGLTPTMSMRNRMVSSSAGRMSSTAASRNPSKSCLVGLWPFMGEGRRGANFMPSILVPSAAGDLYQLVIGDVRGKFEPIPIELILTTNEITKLIHYRVAKRSKRTDNNAQAEPMGSVKARKEMHYLNISI